MGEDWQIFLEGGVQKIKIFMTNLVTATNEIRSFVLCIQPRITSVAIGLNPADWSASSDHTRAPTLPIFDQKVQKLVIHFQVSGSSKAGTPGIHERIRSLQKTLNFRIWKISFAFLMIVWWENPAFLICQF